MSISNPLKLRPKLVSKPEFGIKFSSTPTTVISGSVSVGPNFTSALEVAVNDKDVSVKGYLNLS